MTNQICQTHIQFKDFAERNHQKFPSSAYFNIGILSQTKTISECEQKFPRVSNISYSIQNSQRKGTRDDVFPCCIGSHNVLFAFQQVIQYVKTN